MDDTVKPPTSSFGAAAYGGDGWSPRVAAHGDEIGSLWAACGIDSEWRRLTAVALRRPGAEIAVDDVDASQFLGALDLGRAQAEHDALADAYGAQGVAVIEVGDVPRPSPNRMFCADLFVMTPQGAILGRPASTMRAGEEVAVAAALAGARVPILKTLTAQATFEGADLMWLAGETAISGRGPRPHCRAVAPIANRHLDHREKLARVAVALAAGHDGGDSIHMAAVVVCDNHRFVRRQCVFQIELPEGEIKDHAAVAGLQPRELRGRRLEVNTYQG